MQTASATTGAPVLADVRASALWGPIESRLRAYMMRAAAASEATVSASRLIVAARLRTSARPAPTYMLASWPYDEDALEKAFTPAAFVPYPRACAMLASRKKPAA